jgi:aminocarboxymuconate-semialdehyde decarboxylase
MFFTCTPACCDPAHRHGPRSRAATAKRSATASAPVKKKLAAGAKGRKPGARPPVIDIHCHYLNPELAAKTAHLDPPAHDPTHLHANDLTRATNAAQMKDRGPKLTGVKQRLDDMERMGVDIQAISPAPYQFFYYAEPEEGAALARQVNEGIARIVAETPDRFVGLGSVPLQNAELAIRELDHLVGTLGLRGIEINTNVNGRNLTDPSLGLEKFFARANELRAVIFMHPLGYPEGSRLTEHYFSNVIGNPLDTTVAVSSLIFDGVVARHPKIRFIAAHGGGYVAHYWARMDHAWRARPDCRTKIKRPPSSYLKKFYFDTMVFDPEMLRHLIDAYGADHVLLGTDYPYDMGDDDPRGLVAAVAKLPKAERALIEGLNAAKLLKLGR